MITSSLMHPKFVWNEVIAVEIGNCQKKKKSKSQTKPNQTPSFISPQEWLEIIAPSLSCQHLALSIRRFEIFGLVGGALGSFGWAARVDVEVPIF